MVEAGRDINELNEYAKHSSGKTLPVFGCSVSCAVKTACSVQEEGLAQAEAKEEFVEDDEDEDEEDTLLEEEEEDVDEEEEDIQYLHESEVVGGEVSTTIRMCICWSSPCQP